MSGWRAELIFLQGYETFICYQIPVEEGYSLIICGSSFIHYLEIIDFTSVFYLPDKTEGKKNPPKGSTLQ